MLSNEQILNAQKKAVQMLEAAGIALTSVEKKNIEVCDYQLNDLETIGTQIVIYVNTERCCAKELVMLPWQICPQHMHPAIGAYPGKEETFRCRYGEVYLYVPGPPVKNPKARIPEDQKEYFTVWNEIILRPGEQYTMQPKTLHWFQGGPDGAVVSEFSTTSYDDKDIFTNPNIKRISNL